jgi:three-Cys-motif partner protein
VCHSRPMAERPWGFWTESKLDMLSSYLHAFTTASKRAGKTVYLDLFAGQEQNVNRHTQLPIDGSFRRAIQTTPPFAILRGFEINGARAASLQQAYQAQAPGRDLRVVPGDVHDRLGGALEELADYRWAPTFAFVDPDGVEARWELLEALAAHKGAGRTKVELFLLLAAPQIVRVVHDQLHGPDKQRAEQQVTDLFGSPEWRPILQGRRSSALDAEQTRTELTNLMRWRLEKTLGYKFTHALRLTNLQGVPLYDMIFATDHEVGDKIMRSVYGTAAAKFPRMRAEIRARNRDALESSLGQGGLWTTSELLDGAPLNTSESYKRLPPTSPYGTVSGVEV